MTGADGHSALRLCERFDFKPFFALVWPPGYGPRGSTDLDLHAVPLRIDLADRRERVHQ
jgi:hypothetical protein